MLHAIIMAGGSGTRFWPESRNARPKQLLDLTGQGTMIQTTVNRLGDLVTPERVLVVTNQRLVEPIARQLPSLPPGNIVGEPCKRDTAPCVGLAAGLVQHADDDATMVVMPADHIIQPDAVFQDALRFAADLVDQQPSRIATFGIKPSYAAESFGYIERGAELTGQRASDAKPIPAYSVRKFREKPSAEVARQYLASGDFYWNSGIFVWKAKTVLDALAEFEPTMHAHLQTIAGSIGTPDYDATLDREFTAIKGKSIDYAIMEQYPDVVVVEAPYEWDDVGSWQALSRMRGTDQHGNTLVGKHLDVRTEGSIVRTGNDHLVVTLGLKDCLVVHTPDATLVANKHDEEAIREVVTLLQERGWDEYL